MLHYITQLNNKRSVNIVEKQLKKNSYQDEKYITSHDTYNYHNVIPFVPKIHLSQQERNISSKAAAKSWLDSIRIGKIFLFDSMEKSNPQENDPD